MEMTTILIAALIGCLCIVVLAIVVAVIYWIWKNSKKEPTLK